MKKNCIIINTARAKIVNENDLLDALKNKLISGAGLDMIDGEWMENKVSHPLIQYSLKNDNLLITPHIGGATYESIYGARIFMANRIYDYIKNQKNNLKNYPKFEKLIKSFNQNNDSFSKKNLNLLLVKLLLKPKLTHS